MASAPSVAGSPLSVCRQENRSFVNSGKAPAQGYLVPVPVEWVFPPHGHTGGHAGAPVALLPLASLTWDFLFYKSLNNHLLLKQNTVISFWNSKILFSGHFVLFAGVRPARRWSGGGAGQEKRFGDTTLIVSKSRKYKSSQNSFLQTEASSKTSKAHFFFHFSSAAVTSIGTCF